jgi:hypothetical protein
MRRILTALVLASSLGPVCAQLGGQTSFRVLDIPNSARSSALGGNYIAVYDNDINLGLYNPGLLNAGMGRQLALSYLPYIDGITIGYLGYAHHFDSLGATFAGSVQYVDYGTFTRTDEAGNELGQFKAGEYVVQVGGGIPLDSVFSIGANVKFISSNLDTWNSTAWAIDVGGVYHKESKGITVAALVRNVGRQASTFTSTREKLPWQFQVGTTYKMRHAPFRLGLMVEQLQRWDLTYDDPNAVAQIDPTTGEEIVDKVTFLDKAVLHVVPSVEVLLSQNFMLRVGYNVRRRHELVLPDKPAATGLCFGLGLRVSKFHISYGYAQMHLAGISNTFTIATRFADFRKG